MGGDVAGGFGSGEVDEVEEAMLFGREVGDAETADGVGAGRSVVSERRCGASKGRRAFDEFAHLVAGVDLVLGDAHHLRDAVRVFEEGDGVAVVQEVEGGVSGEVDDGHGDVAVPGEGSGRQCFGDELRHSADCEGFA